MGPAEIILDLVGLRCPFVAARAKEAIEMLPLGGQIVVLASDPLAPLDLAALVQDMGHHIQKVETLDGTTAITIQIKIAAP